MTPRLAVIVPATDDTPSLSRCRASIEASRAPTDELIVVRRAPRRGASSARNEGAKASSAEILVFVDSDVEVHSDALTLIRARFAADPDLVAVFGCYDDEPAAQDVVSTFRNLLHHHVHQESAGPIESFWAGLGAVRRGSFHGVGGFHDLRGVEDVELGARLSRAGGAIELDAAIKGKHLKRWTLPRMVHTDLFLRGIPWTQLALEGRAPRRGLNLGWRHRLSAAASLLLIDRLLRRRVVASATALAALCALNVRFYRLLASRGWRYLFGGIAIHVVHHLTSVLALVLGVLLKPRVLAGLVRPR
jgi:glycosyltransferase involved in cell wall biosynthesis